MAVSEEFRRAVQEKLKDFNHEMLTKMYKQLVQEKKRRSRKKKK